MSGITFAQDNQKLIEYGKDPGLGIRKLNEQGYTGRGVTVAYLDQPLLYGHKAYNNVDLVYEEIDYQDQTMEPSMHGPAVLSFLAGEEIGIAKNSKVYFMAHPSWLADQITHAMGLRRLVTINNTLPKDQKIRLVGVSDTVDLREKNPKEYEKAIKELEASGIMYFDVNTIPIIPLQIESFKDKADPNNYKPDAWWGNNELTGLGVPTTGRTVATGSQNNTQDYYFETRGGLSWAVPYITGVAALGLEIDPTLTKQQIIDYLFDSAYKHKDGYKVINPEGFVKLVTSKKKHQDYYYIVYNNNSLTSSDLEAVKKYSNHLGTQYQVILKDISSYSTATEIYTLLKDETIKRSGKLKGIQIIGVSEDVPAFDILDKVQMSNGIHETGVFKSDFFYSNFNNTAAQLKGFNLYGNFNDKKGVDLVPTHSVTRLPLDKGNIGPFINKYENYIAAVSKMDTIPLINFSNPIFSNTSHNDDMGYFISEQLDKNFGILDSKTYKLYGNKQGKFPITTPVLGDFTKDNLSQVNKQGPMHLFINSHGQFNNIDQAIYQTEEANSEKRISFLNNNDINKVLSQNYYTLTTWTCNNAWNLDKNNLIYKALKEGKCIDAFASTALISNNGVNNKAGLEQMKKNNFYYFHYTFYEKLTRGYSRTDSFLAAQQAYATESLNNTNLLGEGNYQFNLNNLLTYHHLGLIDYTDISKMTQLRKISNWKDPSRKTTNESFFGSSSEEVKISKLPVIEVNQKSIIVYQNDEKEYLDIPYVTDLSNKDSKINTVQMGQDMQNIYIKVSYYNPNPSQGLVFLQGDTPGLHETIKNTEIEDNTIIIKLEKSKVLNYKAGLAINVGNRNFVFIDKEFLQQVISLGY